MLTASRIRKELAGLPTWKLSRGAIRRQFKFRDFRQALSFVNRVGELAEAANHHPDIDIRYSRVRLALSTHDVSGISMNDFDLARSIDAAFGRLEQA